MRRSERGFSPLVAPDAPGGLKGNVTVVVASRREPGVVWIGTDFGQLHRWEDGRITMYDQRNSPLPDGNITDLRESLDRDEGRTSGTARMR